MSFSSSVFFANVKETDKKDEVTVEVEEGSRERGVGSGSRRGERGASKNQYKKLVWD